MSDLNKNVLITEAAREKLVKARAGAITLPKVVGMAFGDGGVDAEGKPIAPVEGQTGLTHEIYRKPVNGYSFPISTTCRYECTLTEQELAGKYINEIGLYDEDGDIVGIKTFTSKGKDDDVEQVYTLDDIF